MEHSFDRLAVHYHLVSDLSRPKNALAAAQHIEGIIARQGWAAGTVIGCEKTLRAKFGLGHRVGREAIRVLQSRNAIQARRGSQGGLVVGRPSRGMATAAIADYLEAIMIRETELAEAQTALSSLTKLPTTMADARIGDVFVAAIEEVHQRQAIQKETEARTAPILDASLRHALPGCAGSTRSAGIARHLMGEIKRLVSANETLWLGTETSLSEQYSVGLAVLRQALRILDAGGFTESRRGRAGGVTGRVPPARGAIETTLTYLSALHLDQLELLPWVAALGDKLNTLAVERWSEDDQRKSEALLGNVGSLQGRWKSLLMCVQWDACGNRVLALVARCAAAYQVRFVPDDYHVRPRDRSAYQEALIEHARAMSRRDLKGARDAIHGQRCVLQRVVERLADCAAHPGV
jgi:DNA-binding FadR family transcriptional regulator